MRFHGQLNVDFNELCTNLVPFPALNLVASSMAPFPSRRSRATRHGGAPSPEELFIAACSPKNALVSIPRSVAATARSVAVGFLARGSDFPVSTLESNIQRSVGMRAAKGYGSASFWAPRSSSAAIKLVDWNLDGVKSGLTAAPCAYAPRAVTVLNNTTGMAAPLSRLRNDFQTLYRMKAHLHHYTDILSGDAIVGAGAMDTALESLCATIDAYEGAASLGQA